MRIAELEAKYEAWGKEREDMRRELRAQEEAGVLKVKNEEAKLELLHKTKEFEEKLAKVKETAWEEFKTSEDCDKIKGEYALGDYLHAFKEARAYLRAHLPDVRPDDLKEVPSIANTLELSGSDDGGDGEDDEDVKGEDEREDDDVQIDITTLNPPLGQIH